MDNHRRKTIFDIVGQVNDNVQDVHNKVHHIFNQYNEMLAFGMDEEDALYWAEQSVMIANGETEKAQAHAVARIEQIKAEELAKHQAQNRFCPIEQINAIRSPYLQ